MNSLKQTFVILAGFLLAFTGSIYMYSLPVSAAECGGVETSLISCPQTGQEEQEDGTTSKDIRNSGVWGILLIILNVMIGLVGVAALAGIVYGSILYTSAGGNMEQTKKGMQVIGNVVIGLIAFGLMYVALNFLIPGGVFSS